MTVGNVWSASILSSVPDISNYDPLHDPLCDSLPGPLPCCRLVPGPVGLVRLKLEKLGGSRILLTLAISGTSGSSGLGSVSMEQMDKRTGFSFID